MLLGLANELLSESVLERKVHTIRVFVQHRLIIVAKDSPNLNLVSFREPRRLVNNPEVVVGEAGVDTIDLYLVRRGHKVAWLQFAIERIRAFE